MRVLLSLLVLACGAAPLSAQVCIGLPRNDVAPTNLGAAVSFQPHVKSVGARFGFGGSSAFGGVTGSYAKLDDEDVSAVGFQFDAGVSVPLTASKNVSVCPLVTAGYVHGPNISDTDGDFKSSTLGATIGIGLGGIAEVTPMFAVIPNVNAGYGFVRQKFDYNGDTESVSDNGASVGGGVSLLFNKIFSVNFGVSVPVAQDDADATFSIGFVIGFKRR